jgi:hypothetical protein
MNWADAPLYTNVYEHFIFPQLVVYDSYMVSNTPTLKLFSHAAMLQTSPSLIVSRPISTRAPGRRVKPRSGMRRHLAFSLLPSGCVDTRPVAVCFELLLGETESVGSMPTHSLKGLVQARARRWAKADETWQAVVRRGHGGGRLSVHTSLTECRSNLISTTELCICEVGLNSDFGRSSRQQEPDHSLLFFNARQILQTFEGSPTSRKVSSGKAELGW